METYCSDCRKVTEVVQDHKSGDTICVECGLVLEAWVVEETAEWRNFNDDTNDKDPNRVGSATNPLLEHGTLVTLISNPKGGGASGDNVVHSRKWSNPDDALIKGFELIGTMADRLGLVPLIKDRANEIFKNVEEQKYCRGRKREAVSAACLFIACRERQLSRTLKEISSVADGVPRKEIHKVVAILKKQHEIETGTVQIGEFVRRFCSNLGMNNHSINAVKEAVDKSKEFDIRRSPVSVLAAIIYMITQLSNEKKPLRDIAVAAEVAEGTIKKSYKDLYPYASRVIPNWYANEEDIKNICCL